MTRRAAILSAILERIEAIRVDQGFETDLGDHVILGVSVTLGESDPDQVAAIVPIDDEVRHQAENLSISWPIEIHAIVATRVPNPWLVVEAAIGDVKRAMELADRTLGGLVPRQIERGTTRAIAREPGSGDVGLAVTYRIPYLEAWGQP